MLRVREAVEDDAQAIAECKRRSWQAAYRDQLPADYLADLPLHPPPEDLAEAIRDGQAQLVVAERDGEIVGLAATGPARDEDLPPATGELFMIYTLEEVWGTGVGHALHEAAIERMVAEGHRQAVLWVLAGNERADGFYQRQGWRPDGARREEDLGGPVREIVRYRRDLPSG